MENQYPGLAIALSSIRLHNNINKGVFSQQIVKEVRGDRLDHPEAKTWGMAQVLEVDMQRVVQPVCKRLF